MPKPYDQHGDDCEISGQPPVFYRIKAVEQRIAELVSAHIRILNAAANGVTKEEIARIAYAAVYPLSARASNE